MREQGNTMNTYLSKQFPIFRDAEQLVIAIEQVVRTFSRYYKYTLGSELRVLASKVLNYKAVLLIQKGSCFSIYNRQQFTGSLSTSIVSGTEISLHHLHNVHYSLRQQGISYCWISEQGYIHNRLKQRQLRELFIAF